MRTIGKILAVALLFLAGAVRMSAATESVNIRFRFSKSEPADFTKLEEILTGPNASKVVGIELRASSSPDGPYWLNKQIAGERATYVADKVKELCPSLGEDAFKSTIVAEDWAGVAKWLRRSGKGYKDEALKIVNETPLAEREAKLKDLWAGEAWDDMMRSAFPALRSVRVTVTFAEEEKAEPKVTLEVKPAAAPVDSESVKICFASGMRYLRPDLGNNLAAFQEIDKMAESGKSLRIVSLTSPEGDPTSNAALAKNRANCLVVYLKENFKLADEKMIIDARGEDWDGLYREVHKTYQEANREKVLEILGNDALTGGAKKAAIRGLDKGATWKHLVKNQMSELRAIYVSAE